MVAYNFDITSLYENVHLLRKKQDSLLKKSDIDDYSGYLEATRLIRNEINDIEYQIELNTPISYERIPAYGDIMEIDVFINFVNNDVFTDIEGVGYYSDGYRMTNKSVYPSDIKSNRIRTDFKYIVWLEEPLLD